LIISLALAVSQAVMLRFAWLLFLTRALAGSPSRDPIYIVHVRQDLDTGIPPQALLNQALARCGAATTRRRYSRTIVGASATLSNTQRVCLTSTFGLAVEPDAEVHTYGSWGIDRYVSLCMRTTRPHYTSIT
jgi:hypothetical protein